MNITAKEAKETTVYVLEKYNEKYEQTTYTAKNGRVITLSPRLVNFALRVNETNLFDFVMESAEETTSPRGVERKWHVREKEQQCSCYDEENETFDPECEKCYEGTEIVYQVCSWGIGNWSPKVIMTFDTEEEAADFLFDRIYKYDFLNDDQRDTEYFSSEEDALEAIVERMADHWNVSLDVASSIIRKHRRIDEAREQLEADLLAKAAEEKALKQERINRVAPEYAAMIERIEGETYKETAARLSQAIGERIESAVFHKAVQIVRRKQ